MSLFKLSLLAPLRESTGYQDAGLWRWQPAVSKQDDSRSPGAHARSFNNQN